MPVRVYKYTEYDSNGHTFFIREYVCLFNSSLNNTSNRNKDGNKVLKNSDSEEIVVVNTIGKFLMVIMINSIRIRLNIVIS